MGIAFHLSCANFLQCKLHFSQPNPFFFFALQPPGDDGEVLIKLDGNTINRFVDFDKGNGFTIAGSSIITMEPGQKVSDAL